MIGWRAGKAVVESVSTANKNEYAHVAGLHEVLVDGVQVYGPGQYAQCVQYRDDAVEIGDIRDGLVTIVPWFDTTGWAPMTEPQDELGVRRSRKIHPTAHNVRPTPPVVAELLAA